MIDKKTAVFGILKRIKELDSHFFPDRLFAQKTIFILKYGFDIDLRYEFSWYLRGPFSPQITRDLYAIKNTKNVEEMAFRDEEKEERFSNAVSFFKNNNFDSDDVEVLSSIIYAKKILEKNKDDCIAWVKEKKPRFKLEQIEDKYSIIEKEGLLN